MSRRRSLFGCLTLLCIILLPWERMAQAAGSDSGIWQDISEKPALAARGHITAATARKGVVPSSYRTLRIDQTRLAAILATAPLHADGIAARIAGVPAAVIPAGAELDLPVPRGEKFARFSVQESPVMEPGLAARHHELRTYLAQGIDDPSLVARLDLTPQGFHALVLSARGEILVDPYFSDGSDAATAIAFYKEDCAAASSFRCLVDDHLDASAEIRRRQIDDQLARPTGATLRTYRLAVACDSEYSAAAGNGNLSDTLAAIVTIINRVNTVYERDLAIHLTLVNAEESIIYPNASSDPYAGEDEDDDALLLSNRSNLDDVIGSANYDIGHIFTTGGGGIASLGVVCVNGKKARGVTGLDTPIGDPYAIDYVAHEMGHEFGANHPFNSTSDNCEGNRNDKTAYEVGSGSTVMSYAGICDPDDLAPHSDDYFHTISYDEIDADASTGAGTCSVNAASGNTPPVVSMPASFVIPIGTPFALTAAATDPDVDDTLTYCWEEFDLGPAQNPSSSPKDNGSSPIFRSYAPTLSPTRVFPALTYILNDANLPPTPLASGFISGEALPSTSRTMKFRCTVRDNHAGAGGSNYGLTSVTSTTLAGPFAVTAPNAPMTLATGAPLSVAWNVAGANVSPVNCANVKISLSADGGYTFPYVLAASIPNTGSAAVTLPSGAGAATTQARVKVEAVGNIFFDISDQDFTITSNSNSAPSVAVTGAITVSRGSAAPVATVVGTVADENADASTVTTSGAPFGASVTGAVVSGNLQLTASASCTVTTANDSRTYPLIVTVTDPAGAAASAAVDLIVTPNAAPTLGAYSSASVAAGTAITVSPAAGAVDPNGNLSAAPFSVFPTTLVGGGTLSVDQSSGAVTAVTVPSTASGATTVTVTLQDTCGEAVAQIFTVTVTGGGIGPTPTPTPIPDPRPVFGDAMASGVQGQAFSYQLTATNAFAYNAQGLPLGLTFDPNTGLIAGTPLIFGNFTISVSATNSFGTTSAALSLQIAAAPLPQITVAATTPVALRSGAFGIFTVTRTGDVTLPLKIFYAAKGAGANGVDYKFLKGSKTIKAGSAAVEIKVKPIAVPPPAANKGVKLVLQPNSSYLLLDSGTAKVKIKDAP